MSSVLYSITLFNDTGSFTYNILILKARAQSSKLKARSLLHLHLGPKSQVTGIAQPRNDIPFCRQLIINIATPYSNRRLFSFYVFYTHCTGDGDSDMDLARMPFFP